MSATRGHGAPVAAYWAMPLFNLVVSWTGHEGSGLENHPMRLWRTPDTVERKWPGQGERAVQAAGGDGLIAFEFGGRPAFVEPMPYYREAVAALHEGKARRLITAVAVGEVCGHDVEALEKWFPFDLHEVLGLATGMRVGSPYIEFRDAKCRWLERHHIHWGHPNFQRRRGHATIDEQIHRGTGALLTSYLSIPIPERTYLSAAMHHAVLGGLSSTNIDDRLSAFFRAFERICKTRGIGAEDPTANLDRNNFAIVEQALHDAEESMLHAAKNAQKRGDEGQAKTLRIIADRVRGVKGKSKDFGRQLSRLLSFLGLHDEAAADEHFPIPVPKAPQSWSGAASMYRNAVVHDGYLDAFGEAYREGDAEDFALHMHDLLIRVLLKLVGYEGNYQPATTRDLDTRVLDWVETDTAPLDLGYGQHRP